MITKFDTRRIAIDGERLSVNHVSGILITASGVGTLGIDGAEGNAVSAREAEPRFAFALQMRDTLRPVNEKANKGGREGKKEKALQERSDAALRVARDSSRVVDRGRMPIPDASGAGGSRSQS